MSCVGFRWACAAFFAAANLVFGQELIPGDLPARVNQAFHLTDSTIVTLDVPAQAMNFEIQLPLEGDVRLVRFKPHSVRSDSYEVKVQLADGSLINVPPSPIRTVRGTVEGIDGSDAAGAITDDGLEARILLPDGRSYWIQAVRPVIADAPVGTHVVYAGEQSIPSGGQCGTQDAADDGDDDPIVPHGAGCGAPICVAELACDADFEYYQDYGSNVTNVENRINLVINTMNTQYQNQVGLSHLITTIIVRTSEPDPYSLFDAGDLLNQFRNEWLANQTGVPRDVAMLFTGKELNGTTVGIAFAIGAICNTSAYCLVQSDCCAPNLPCATDLSAHELGHLWDATHCSCSTTTMNAGLTCANTFIGAGSGSVAQITAYRDTLGCLSPLGSPPPFTDDFEVVSINTTKWITVVGAVISTAATNEPSPTRSVQLDANDQIASNQILMGDNIGGTFSYFTERVGTEAADSLVVEYFNNSGDWIVVNTIAGGANQSSFQFWTHDLATLAGSLHDGFRIRFRTVGDSTDDWYVDNVSLTGIGDTIPPEPNPMVFSTPPTGNSISSVFMITAVANDALNNPVEYFFDYLGTGNGGNDSAWQAGTVFIDAGLLENTAYSYCVKARDSAPIPNETMCSTPASVGVTWIAPAAGITLGTISDTSVGLTATGSLTNLNLGQSGLFWEYLTDGGLTIAGNSGWIQTNPFTATGLTPDTAYSFRVKSRNQIAVEASFTTGGATITRASIPGAPVLNNETTTSMDINVAPNGNPAHTLFSIQCQATSPSDPAWLGQFVNELGQPIAEDVVQTDAQWGTLTIQGLQPATNYTFAVRALSQNGIQTDFGPTASAMTDSGGVVVADCDGNGTFDPAVDMACFVDVLLGLNVDSGAIARSDLNADTMANGLDIPMFVDCAVNGCP
jgi:hypothetical protein